MKFVYKLNLCKYSSRMHESETIFEVLAICRQDRLKEEFLNFYGYLLVLQERSQRFIGSEM